MGRKPTGNPNGRPKKVINKDQFETLCYIQCTQEEICAVLDVCCDTLDNWCNENYGATFSKVYKDKRLGGKMSLRRKQWKLADTSATMAIFLGKNLLGQSDRGLDEEGNERSTGVEVRFANLGENDKD